MAALYVYRLHVDYPSGSQEAGWEPPGWEPEFIGEDTVESWRWPRNRPYFSKKGAEERANLFRKYGAEVTVERSKPVEWGET